MEKINRLFLALLLISTHTIYAQIFDFGEIPEWVEKVDIPKESSISQYDVLSGYYLTLADYQFNIEKETSFKHDVINVISYSGITNASQISVSFDTAYQELIIHHLYIWRNGKKIDRTKDLSFEIINNEVNLQQGIYTGQITLYDNLNDIRKDDLIDFAYSIKGYNPIFQNEKYLFIPLQMLNPIDLYAIRVLIDAEKDYQYKCSSCDSTNLSVTLVDNYKVITINEENVKSIELEDRMPSWSLPFKYFSISSQHSWVEVNKWAQDIFSLAEEPDLKEVFDEIFTGDETTEDKINKIIDFVQDDIRYMGIESGIGSIKPFPPDQVVVQRFGDCKDKSLLLVSLLKKIGVEKAYPVLLNTIMQDHLDELYPSNELFNHAIVRFDYNDTIYWVDPSMAQQGGDFHDLFCIDYGKVLIAGLPADTLYPMSPNNKNTGAKIMDEYTMESFTEPASLKIISTRYGFEADQRRLMMHNYTTKNISDIVSKELQMVFPVVNRTEDLVISDNIESNQFVVVYNYEVDGFWTDKEIMLNNEVNHFWLFRFEPVYLYQYLNETSCEKRNYEYELYYPLNLSYRVIFHFPQKILIQDDLDIFDNEAFHFEEKVEQIDSNSLQIDYSFHTKKKSVKAEEYLDICKQRSAIAKELPVIIYFYK